MTAIGIPVAIDSTARADVETAFEVIVPIELPPLQWLRSCLPWSRFTARDTMNTAIRWTYTFRPRRYATPVVRLLTARLWRGYAKRALGLAIDEVEKQQP